MNENDKLSVFVEYFTHGEAVRIAGVTSKELNNWTQRGIVDLGKMTRTNRKIYSIKDIMILKIIGQLNIFLNSPSISNDIAEAIIGKAISYMIDDQSEIKSGFLQMLELDDEDKKPYIVVFINDNGMAWDISTLHSFFVKHPTYHLGPVLVMSLKLICDVYFSCMEIISTEDIS